MRSTTGGGSRGTKRNVALGAAVAKAAPAAKGASALGRLLASGGPTLSRERALRLVRLYQADPTPPMKRPGLRSVADVLLQSTIGQNVGQTTGAWLHPGRSGGMGEVPWGRIALGAYAASEVAPRWGFYGKGVQHLYQGMDRERDAQDYNKAVLDGPGSAQEKQARLISPNVEKYTKQQLLNQRRKEVELLNHTRDAFLFDVHALVDSGQMTKARATQARKWALGSLSTVFAIKIDKLRSGRAYLHENYKPPVEGWWPAP
jgi:hypothetical protein